MFDGPMHSLQAGSYGGGTNYYGAGVAACNGPFTATLKWVPDKNEDPPLSLIVSEQCSTTGWSIDQNASFTANTGLPNAQINTDTSTSTPYPSIYKSSTYYWVKNNPGAEFDITCSPSISATSTFQYSATTVGLQYVLMTTPVEENLGGVTTDNDGNQHILIGQGCKPELKMHMSMGGIFFDNYAWTIPGLRFKDYVAGTNYSLFTPLTVVDLVLPTFTFYWKEPLANASVQATATAYMYVDDPNAVLPPAPIALGAVSGISTTKIWKPDSTFTSVQGPITKEFDPGTGGLVNTGLNPKIGNPIRGIEWTGSVQCPDIFKASGQGRWALVQLWVPHRVHTIVDNLGVNIPHTWNINGMYSLDSRYPVGFDDKHQAEPDDGTEHKSNDNPFNPLLPTSRFLFISESFETYLLYQPFDKGYGTKIVPLSYIPWSWDVNEKFDVAIGLTQIGAVSAKRAIPFPTHPIWNLVTNDKDPGYTPPLK